MSIQNLSSKEIIETENQFGAHHTAPLPVVFDRAQGIHVWDPEGKKYFDFLSCFSVVNQGHCHPKIIQALMDQAQKCTLSSRAFHNSQLCHFEKLLTEKTGYDRVLTMNTGVEAVEVAVKIARKWGYDVKKIPVNRAMILTAKNNFHGRTLTAISMSTDPICYKDFGPYLPFTGVETRFQDDEFTRHSLVDFNDIASLENALEKYGHLVAAFLVEPIQGEAGIIVPDDDYLEKVYDICKKYNVLLIVDEIQTGLCRTGKTFAYQHYLPDEKTPDLVLVGKALSGGVLPISAVLGNDPLMLTLTPGQHGSTFGGNPLAAAVGIAAIHVLFDENLAQNANDMGIIMQEFLEKMKSNFPFIKQVRGKGLLRAIELDAEMLSKHEKTGRTICIDLVQNGFLTKPTHGSILRLAPPLIIKKEELTEALDILWTCFSNLLNSFGFMP